MICVGGGTRPLPRGVEFLVSRFNSGQSHLRRSWCFWYPQPGGSLQPNIQALGYLRSLLGTSEAGRNTENSMKLGLSSVRLAFHSCQVPGARIHHSLPVSCLPQVTQLSSGRLLLQGAFPGTPSYSCSSPVVLHPYLPLYPWT